MTSTCGERIEWVEIIEPRTKEHMYANLTTGECVWDPPEDVPIKRTDSSQWWELFDPNTKRFYYYNASTQKTVWHRPNKCDIIPLAKLQTLKQNTDPNDRRDYSPHTVAPITDPVVPEPESPRPRTQRSSGGGHLPAAATPGKRSAGSEEKLHATELISSPRGRQNFRGDVPQFPARRTQADVACNHYKDVQSGKSSDSSLSSVHGYRRINDVTGSGGGSSEALRLGSLQKHRSRKDAASASFEALQESGTGGHHLPPHAASFGEHPLLSAHLQGCCPSPKALELASPTHSAHTPQPKKKISPDSGGHHHHLQQQQQQHQQQHQFTAFTPALSPRGKAPHPILDYGADRDFKVSLARSGSFMSSSINPAAAGHHSKSYRKSSGEANGGAASDDSMHEKYFKSVENTPLARRRHTTNAKGSTGGGTTGSGHKKHSSDSASPQSPLSPQTKAKPSKSPQTVSLNSHTPSPGHAPTSSHGKAHYKQDSSCSLELLNLDKMALTKPPTSPHLSDIGGGASTSPNHVTATAALKNFPSSDNIGMLTHSSRGSSSTESRPRTSTAGRAFSQQTPAVPPPTAYAAGSLRHNSASLDKHGRHSSDVYYDHTKRDRRDSRRAKAGQQQQQHHKHHQQQQQHHLHADNSDAEYDNGNTSPLYSNWDQEMQEHLLPLKHYIIEQAKLSGHYVFGDPADSDSYHSDSQSEHSLSGHEPDNEDSDGGSDTHGGYLEHNYGMIDDYANMGDSVSYYAYQYPPYDPAGREDLSDNVEAVLEGIGSGGGSCDLPPPSKNSSRYQIAYYDSAAHNAAPPSQKIGHIFPPASQQLYSNAPAAHAHPHSHSHPHPPPHQNLQLDPVDVSKSKQSQTLPSPNRQISRIAQSVLDGGGMVGGGGGGGGGGLRLNLPHYPKEESINRKLQPPSLKPTIQQIFPPSERAPQGLGGIPTLACMKECDIEKFAADNLNLHSKGIFRKKSSVRDMLSWTAEAISRPMLALSRDKTEKKIAIEVFKLVQIYMGDRKARAGMSLNSVAIDVIVSALPQQQLRDELFVQLCRQTTENPKRESLIRGWELMAICLSFVPPSPTFQPTLLNYVNRHRDPSFATSFPEVGKWPIHVQISHYATVCCRRLERIGSSGRRHAKKPTEDEVEQARNQILRNSMFGNTLSEVMDLQKDKFPTRRLPWIQTTLSEHVLLLNGKQTEGIFRVSADVDEVNCLKNRLDRWEVPDYKNTMVDAHAPASLLKLWYRELYDPLIPDELYEECVNTEDPLKAKEIVNRLPDLNKLVLTYLVQFLQQFSHSDVVSCTKMDSSNLAMVFAPNCLRCTSDDPKVILENARKEMSFMRTLIQHMDTTPVANLT